MHLINTPPNPRQLLREINLVPKDPPRLVVRPQRVQRAADDARVALLVVEDGECASGHYGGEDGERAEPAVGGREGGKGAVGAAFH
jgi:hypothetical protein